MPYKTHNRKATIAVANAHFYTSDSIRAFANGLISSNATVIESLRDQKAALTTFLASGRKGSEIVKGNSRWPQDEDPFQDTLFYSTYDGELRRVIASIAGALDDRVASSTREEANSTGREGKGRNLGEGARAMEDTGNDARNALKSMIELRGRLWELIDNPSVQWERAKFENQAVISWE